MAGPAVGPGDRVQEGGEGGAGVVARAAPCGSAAGGVGAAVLCAVCGLEGAYPRGAVGGVGAVSRVGGGDELERRFGGEGLGVYVAVGVGGDERAVSECRGVLL